VFLDIKENFKREYARKLLKLQEDHTK